MLPDIKVEHDLLIAAIVYEDYGSFKVNGGGGGFTGGFAGGPEGAIIEGLVKSIAGWMVYHDSWVATGVGQIGVSTSRRMIMQRPVLSWASSVVCQALNNKTGIMCFAGGGAASGPGTETRLLELAMGRVRAPIKRAVD